MPKLWLVAKHEYLRIVREKSFLVGTFALPAIMVVVMGISILVSLGQRGRLPLGYVDLAGVLSSAVSVNAELERRSVEFRAFDDEAQATEAVLAKEIQAAYVLMPDYLDSGQVKLIYLDREPSEIVRRDFRDFLRANLLEGQPAEVRERLTEGARVTVRAADGSRQMETDNLLNFILPFASAFIFVFAVMNSAGYMLQAVTDEKESRTMEILATSVRPLELIAGKALGLMSVGLTQLALWAGTGVAAILVAAQFIEQIGDFSPPWSMLWISVAFFLPAYALIAGLMTAIGSAVTDLRQGQQISGILNLLFTMPFFFIALIMARPNSPLVVGLSLFPTSAFITITMRWAITNVPLWQIITSWLLLVLSAAFSVWVAARVFRMGMLHYGQRLSLKSIVAALRGSG